MILQRKCGLNSSVVGRLHRCILPLVIASIFLIRSDAIAEPVHTDRYDEAEQARVAALFHAQKCEETWEAIWPHVKEGSPVAGQNMLLAIGFLGLQPPWPQVTANDMYEIKSNPATKRWQQFVADIAFAMDVRKVQRSKERLETQEFKRQFLEQTWSSEMLKRYDAEGCLGDDPRATCMDPVLWEPETHSMNYWDAQILANKSLGLKARCQVPMHGKK